MGRKNNHFKPERDVKKMEAQVAATDMDMDEDMYVDEPNDTQEIASNTMSMTRSDIANATPEEIIQNMQYLGHQHGPHVFAEAAVNAKNARKSQALLATGLISMEEEGRVKQLEDLEASRKELEASRAEMERWRDGHFAKMDQILATNATFEAENQALKERIAQLETFKQEAELFQMAVRVKLQL